MVPGCTYGGDALTLMEARRRENKEYLMALHFNVHVDASDATCLGYLARYVNDAEAELSETRSDDTKTSGDVAEGLKKITPPSRRIPSAVSRDCGPRARSRRARS